MKTQPWAVASRINGELAWTFRPMDRWQIDLLKAQLEKYRVKLIKWIQGFTLIELMIAVAIIGILSSIATVKIKSAVDKANEGMTLANLAVMKSAIGAQMAVNEGAYPTDNLQCLITNGILREFPMVKIPPNGDGVFKGHPAGNTVGAGSYASWGGSDAKWYYFNNPLDSDWYGKVVVNCNHNTSKGKPWDSL